MAMRETAVKSAFPCFENSKCVAVSGTIVLQTLVVVLSKNATERMTPFECLTVATGPSEKLILIFLASCVLVENAPKAERK